jgi:glycosyltransferase involved in cell wall biosynthesis
MRRLRLAFFSPFNPQKSGVSDYSEELLPYLAEKADIDLITGPYPLSNPEMVRRFRVRSVDEFLADAASYDLPVYQVANSFEHHGYMLPAMERVPGVVVLHDFYLHFLLLGLTLQRGNMRLLRRILDAVYGRRGLSYAARLWLSIQDPYRTALTRPLIDASRAVISHSDYARSLILADSPAKHVTVIPMGVPLGGPRDRAALRLKHGVADGNFIVASVSTLSHTKRTEVLLAAMTRLARSYPQLRLWILGGGKLSERARRLLDRSGLNDRVRLTGWTPPETYSELLACADAVADLRYPSGAETSASLLRAIAAGCPCIVSAQGSFLELPPAFSLRIPVGDGEIERVERALAGLIENPAHRDAMAAAALEYAHTRLRLDRAADLYIDTIRAALVFERTAGWDLSTCPAAPVRFFWSTTYKLFRLGYLFRSYGLRATLARVRSEARLRRTAA